MQGRSEPTAVIVGAGMMGRWHLRELRRLGIPVRAVIDSDIEKASQLARNVTGCVPAGDLAGVLEEGGATAVHVCTPLATHFEIASIALESNAHVLVEKPVAPDRGRAGRLAELAAERNLIICPVFQFLFQRGFRRLSTLASGAGVLLHIDAVACSAGASSAGVRQKDICLDILPHPLSMILRLAGGLPDAWGVRWCGDGELRASGTVGNTSVSVLVSMNGRPTRNTLRAITRRGTYHADLFHDFCVTESGAVSRYRKIMRPFDLASHTLFTAGTNLMRRLTTSETAYPGLRELVRRFYAAIGERGDPAPVSVGEMLAVAEGRDGIISNPGSSAR